MADVEILLHILDCVFKSTADSAKATRLLYQFASEELRDAVAPLLREFMIALDGRPQDSDGNWVAEIFVQDVPLTKGRTMLFFAKRVAKYREMKKDLDFEPLGMDWKGNQDLVGEIVPKFKLYEGSYGQQVDNKK